MRDLLAAARAWHRRLAPRERRLTALGGAVLALLLVYLAGVQPLVSAHARLVDRLHRHQALLHYIDAAAPRLRATGEAPAGGAGGGQSVFAAVSAAAQNSALAAAVQRIEQTGDGGVRVSLAAAPFDALVRWLGKLADGKGIVVTEASIQRAAEPGTVNATLTLNGR